MIHTILSLLDRQIPIKLLPRLPQCPLRDLRSLFQPPDLAIARVTARDDHVVLPTELIDLLLGEIIDVIGRQAEERPLGAFEEHLPNIFDDVGGEELDLQLGALLGRRGGLGEGGEDTGKIGGKAYLVIRLEDVVDLVLHVLRPRALGMYLVEEISDMVFVDEDPSLVNFCKFRLGWTLGIFVARELRYESLSRMCIPESA